MKKRFSLCFLLTGMVIAFSSAGVCDGARLVKTQDSTKNKGLHDLGDLFSLRGKLDRPSLHIVGEELTAQDIFDHLILIEFQEIEALALAEEAP